MNKDELEDKVKGKLQRIAKQIKNELPEDFAFILLTCPFNKKPNEGQMMYVSNANRDDVVKAMKEFIQKTEKNFGNDTKILVHGAMQYRCEKCGKEWRMWLEVGVEGENKKMPCPFSIRCKCGGLAQHINWQDDIWLPKPIPLEEKMSYFQLDRKGLNNHDSNACGIPVLK